jgi:hypothetical protein
LRSAFGADCALRAFFVNTHRLAAIHGGNPMRGLATRPGSRSPPAPDVTIQMLKNSEQRLLEMVRRVGYGSLGNIPVHNGELQLGAKVHTRRRHRLGKSNGEGASSLAEGDYKLKRQHRELISRIRQISEGSITIDVQDGLPMSLIVDALVGD